MEFRLKKGYRPYEAYQYLEPGKDFKIIDWADWDWAGRNAIELNEEEEARCGELLAKYPYISLHDHPDFTTRDMSTCEPLFDAMRTGRDRCGYEALAYSNLDCIFDNMMMVPTLFPAPPVGNGSISSMIWGCGCATLRTRISWSTVRQWRIS